MSFAPWKIWIAYLNSPIPKTLSYVQKNVSLPCTELKYVQFSHIFCLNLVVMATLFALLKILIAYCYSRTPKTLLFTVKIFRFLALNWNQCNFGWRLFKFGCHGNSFWSLKNSDNIVNSLTPSATVHAKKFSVFYTELKFVQFWLVLPICCHSNALCFLKYSDSIFEFYNPETISYT